MNLSVIIPVYHEEKNIEKVLRIVSKKIKTPHEVLVIYDTPKDPTYPVIKKYQKKQKSYLRLIRNDRGNGRGVMNAIKTGFANAKGEAVVVIMADLSDDVSQVDKMYTLIQKGYSVVCASRFMKGGKKIGGTWLKNLLSKTADITLHHLVRLPTHDATNAYKMYNKKFLDSITIESTGGFEYSLEITLKAFFKGLKITEIPTIWRDREAGKSNFQLRKWLPQYIKWYAWALREKFSLAGMYVLYTLSAVLVTSLYIGSQIKSKIPVTSTLDLSWQTDAVERFLHGFLAGKDYIFTYGPLFQWIYSLPSVLFHVPSYVSVPLASIILSVLVAASVLYISLWSSETKTDTFLLPPVLLFIVGIVPLMSENSGIRFLLPIVYACLWIPAILKKQISFVRMVSLTVLPSFFGLYVYDLFPQMVLVGGLFILYVLIKEEASIGKKLFHGLGFIAGIAGFQILTSFLVSHSLSYMRDSLTTLSDYYYIMNTIWESGRHNYLFIFPVVMVISAVWVYRSSLYSSRIKIVFLVLTVTALTQLRTALIRSDSGHILSALYPSMLVAFILLYHMIKTKRIVPVLLFIALFTLVPFRDNIYSYLSAKNINALVHVIKNKQHTAFLDIYSFPKAYAVPQELFQFIRDHKGKVMVFPYDTFLLNTQHTTFNTYALQFYDYSNSAVEQRTVTQLQNNPPKYIILQVDKRSTSPLDGIPNFTRNPLIAMWMLEHYSVSKELDQMLVLEYNPDKEKVMPAAERCSVWTVVGNFIYTNPFDLIKPSQFYFILNGALRLPVKPGVSLYIVLPGSDTISELKNLFNSSISFSNMVENKVLESRANVVSVNIVNHVSFYPDTKMYCVQ